MRGLDGHSENYQIIDAVAGACCLCQRVKFVLVQSWMSWRISLGYLLRNGANSCPLVSRLFFSNRVHWAKSLV